MEKITLIEWLTVTGLFFGPIIAVFVTRFVDSLRDNQARRLEIFKILMRTRNYRLNPDHVGALNLVEIEFYKEKDVLNALERYLQHLNDDSNRANWGTVTGHLLTKLLYEIAKSLKYQIDQLQILNGGYVPQGWLAAEDRQTNIQTGLLSILKGEVAIPVRIEAVQPKFEVPPEYPQPPV